MFLKLQFQIERRLDFIITFKSILESIASGFVSVVFLVGVFIYGVDFFIFCFFGWVFIYRVGFLFQGVV